MGPHRSRSQELDEQMSADVRDVLNSIRRIVRWLRVSSRAAEKVVGLSAAQLFVMSRLQAESAMSLNELAERTLTHQSSASVVVSRLVDRGLVQRSRSDRDARRIELRLTPAGRRLLARAPHAAQEQLVAGLQRMNARDLRRLSDLLQRFLNLADIREPAEMFFLDEDTKGKLRSDGRK